MMEELERERETRERVDCVVREIKREREWVMECWFEAEGGKRENWGWTWLSVRGRDEKRRNDVFLERRGEAFELD